MKYDFIIFESYHQARNHSYDLLLIGRMLNSQGLKVAIFDLYHEIKKDMLEGLPVIHWVSKCQVPDDSWRLRKHTIWETLIKSKLFSYQQHRYMKEALSFIKDKADAFYCGSYHNGMSTVFFQLQKPCYWWGLRSERLRFSWKKLLPSPLSGFHIWLERKRFLKNPYQRLFVSNQIIMDEHEQLGVSRDRMVIREERVVEKSVDANLHALDKNLTFLVIGQLRPQKHVSFTVDAFKKANIPNSRLKLIGRSQGDYEKEICSAIAGDNRIVRHNAFLEYEDFNKHFSESHFVLFADEQGPSCITNGTMTEALINHRPIICPDYNPYNYYIDKYGVGLLYEPGNVESYSFALQKAEELGVEHFQQAIDIFLHTINFDIVAKNLVTAINNSKR